VGDEELLVARAIRAVAATVRESEPGVDVIDGHAAELQPGELAERLGPSLFGEAKMLVIRSAQDLPAGTLKALLPYLAAPATGVTIVVQHAGGAKGKAVLDAVRKSKPKEIVCAKPTRVEERYDFVRSEVRNAGGTITADAVAQLVEAVGGGLRELAAVSAQLVSDSGGRIDADVVAAYHRGRAEVTGFAVSDRAVVGDVAGALEMLRWALSVGVAHVLIADALADGVRTVARVSSAGHGDPHRVGSQLGMPSWKVRRAQAQSRTWTEGGLRQALQVVAAVNADVKGAAVDPGWALEHGIRQLAAARALR
jgi:DNA polymerase-3 subunit delta